MGNVASKIISILIVLIIITQIIIGGIFLPVKQASAFCIDAIGGGSNIVQTISDFIKHAWDYAKDAWNKINSAEILKVAKLGNVAGKAKDLYDKVKPYVEKAAKIGWNVLRKKLLTELVNSIIKNIQGQEGKPKFVTNWEAFLRDAANEAGGAFIESDPNLDWLCDSFGTEVKIGLGAAPTFKEEIGCTLDDVEKNIDDFYDDMTKGNGWDGWLKVSQSNNNVFGAYWTVMGEKMQKQAEAREAAMNEAVSSTGFLGDKVCDQWDCDQLALDACTLSAEECEKKYCTCKKWRTRTPGRIAAEAVSKSVNLDIDWLISAKEFEEYAGAIFDAVFNRVAREGLAGMQTDDYQPSRSDSQAYNEMMKNLNAQNAMMDKMASGSKYSADSTIDIANRKGQRLLLLQYQKQLRDLKHNIEKAVIYLREQEKNAVAMEDCAEFKNNMCSAHADDATASYVSSNKNNLCDMQKELCLTTKKTNCELLSDAVEKNQCILDSETSCQSQFNSCISINPIESSDLYAHFKSLVLEKMDEKCSDIQDKYAVAQEFNAYLNIREEKRNLELIYSTLPQESYITREILQKLEKYKPFDECSENYCANLENSEECRNMVWTNPDSKTNFIINNCSVLPEEQAQQCELEFGCSNLYDDTEKQLCEQDQVKIAEKQACRQNWITSCKNGWNSKISNFTDKNNINLFGKCYTQKAEIVMDFTFEEFNNCVNAQTAKYCGNSPTDQCKNDIYVKLTSSETDAGDPTKGFCYSPFNVCIKDGAITSSGWQSGCGENASAECYNKITSESGLCYDKKFESITYDSLMSDISTKITEEDIKTMQTIQEENQMTYANIGGSLQAKLKTMQRSNDKCYDDSIVPDGTYNDFELTTKCIANVANSCAPFGISGDAWDYVRGIKTNWHGTGKKIRKIFDYTEWESYWRGCYKCTILSNECNYESTAACQTWWSSKNNEYPIPIANHIAKTIDIWNVNLSQRYWPNTTWTVLFKLTDEEINTLWGEFYYFNEPFDFEYINNINAENQANQETQNSIEATETTESISTQTDNSTETSEIETSCCD